MTTTADRNAFRRAVEARDLEGMLAPFRDDAVLHSPISYKPFEGRAAIGVLFSILLEVFEGLEYTDELLDEDGDTKALIFRTRIGDREAQGLDLIRFDEAGRIRDFTVMIRPRSASEALRAAVAPRLAAAAAAQGDG